MRKSGILAAVFWLGLWMTEAQIGGTAVYRFMNLSPSPVQTALGGKQFVSVPYDIMQNFSNPALVSPDQFYQVGLNFTRYITDIYYGQVGYVWNIPKAGALFSGITYLNYGRFVAANEAGDITGTFTASEWMWQAGYAYPLSEKWTGGVSLKFIRSQLENFSSAGIAADLSVTYRSEFSEAVILLRNIGTQLTTYNGTREPLPFEAAVSYARLLEHAPLRLFVTFENLQDPAIAFVNPARAQIDPDGNEIPETIRLYDHVFRHIITGAEIFPRKRFRLRIGYNFRRAAELGLEDIHFSSGLSYGFGLRLNKFTLDYAYGQYHFAGNVHHLGLHFSLKPNSHEKD